MKTSKQQQIERDEACYRKARVAGERTFTLRERDKSSPKTILYWIMLNWDTCPTLKLQDAFEDAINMRDSALDKRVAD